MEAEGDGLGVDAFGGGVLLVNAIGLFRVLPTSFLDGDNLIFFAVS